MSVLKTKHQPPRKDLTQERANGDEPEQEGRTGSLKSQLAAYTTHKRCFACFKASKSADKGIDRKQEEAQNRQCPAMRLADGYTPLANAATKAQIIRRTKIERPY